MRVTSALFTNVLTLSFQDFELISWLLFSVVLLLGFKIADWFTTRNFIWRSFGDIPPKKLLKDEDLTFTHYLYTFVNRCITTPVYFYHTKTYIYSSHSDLFESQFDISARSALQFVFEICMFLIIYDFVYYFFHRALHNRLIYPYIHKHHHHQISPYRGTFDGINTHILEYLFGVYLHLWSVIIFQYVFYPKVYFYSAAVFFLVAGLMASLNHTRFAVRVPFLYDVRDHDIHHRYPCKNYAQFVMCWDHLFGTFKPYFEFSNRQIERQIAQQLQDKERQQPMRAHANANANANANTTEDRHDFTQNKHMKKCVITGGNGMVGTQLILMLIESGVQEIVCIDIHPPSPSSSSSAEIQKLIDSKLLKWVKVDITELPQLMASQVFVNTDAVFHIAAVVGPYHKHDLYFKVNVIGTQNIIRCCQEFNVPALIDCTSPATRYDGYDINGKDELDFDGYPTQFTHEYARTKALAEQCVLRANNTAFADRSQCGRLYTCAIAPHQIYGVNDSLFLPALLDAAYSGKLRIFGTGQYYVSFTHVCNICHALILAANALLSETRINAGQFYFVTDGGAHNFWDQIDKAVKACGLKSLKNKMYLNRKLLFAVGYIGWLYSKISGDINVRLTPFSVRMTTINRYFCIGKIKRELGYRPLVSFEGGWNEVVHAVVAKRKGK